MLGKISNALWGKFESRDEFRKFGLLATIFGLIIGVYWTMRPAKDGIFGAIVGTEFTPQAKILSVFIIVPLVLWYTKLVGTFARRKVFYGITLFYALACIVIALFLMHPKYGEANTVASPTRLIGWIWYVLVESFGSLVVALFWAIVTEITPPDQAKRGFPLIALFAQLGNMAFPLIFFISGFALWLGANWPIVAICGVLVLMASALLWYFMNTTPKNQLVGYHGEEDVVERVVSWAEALRVLVIGGTVCLLLIITAFLFFTDVGAGFGLTSTQIYTIIAGLLSATAVLCFVDNKLSSQNASASSEHEAGFFDGLKVLFSHGYMFALFLMITFYEIIVTIVDFHFKMLAKAAYPVGIENTIYLGQYAFATGVMASLCVALGINNIQRNLGMKASLILMPILVMTAVLMVKFNPTALTVAFWIMVLSKAVNYALNQPTIKQLYIPTSKEAKFKAVAWIDMFGSRGAKGPLASSFNNLRPKFVEQMGGVAGVGYFLTLATIMSGGIVVVWILAAIYISNKYDKAIKEDKVVC